MNIITMFLASVRIARELDRTRYVAGPDNTEALVDAVCANDNRMEVKMVSGDKRIAAAGSLPNPV